MNINEKTIGDIIENEKLMLLNGEEKFGEFYTHSFNVNELLNNFIKFIIKTDYFLFINFLSQIKKHLTLALFSYLRQHHIQGGMNVRQSLEAISWCIYALGNNEKEKFCTNTKTGGLEVSKKLGKLRNEWLMDNFTEDSQVIKNIKKIINDSIAHSNIVYTFQNCDSPYINEGKFKITFFDIYDEYKIKNDLYFVSNVTIGFLNLFYTANEKFKIIEFKDNFLNELKNLGNQNDRLKQELMSNERFIK